jgi:hypothetical protein
MQRLQPDGRAPFGWAVLSPTGPQTGSHRLPDAFFGPREIADVLADRLGVRTDTSHYYGQGIAVNGAPWACPPLCSDGFTIAHGAPAVVTTWQWL